MSLKERLLKSASASATSSAPSSGGVLFPLASVKDFLKQHAIVRALQVCEKEVHSAVLEAHKRFLTRESDTHVSYPPSVSRCPECMVGFIVIDTREAIRVCDSCGIVQHRGTLNIAPEFTIPPDVKHSSTVQIKGVPSWMLQASLTDDSAYRNSKHWSELQHFNTYANLSMDDLTLMDSILKEWSGGGFSSHVRIAAALLYLPLKEKFPSEDAIRKHVQRGEGIPVVKDIVPKAEFSCITCGKECYTKKDARFCCKQWGKRKR